MRLKKNCLFVILVLMGIMMSCNPSHKKAEPTFSLNRDQEIIVQNKELHINAINSVFETYKENTGNEINSIQNRLKLCSSLYISKLKEFFYLAVYGSKSKIQRLTTDEQVIILTLRLSVEKETLLQKDLISKLKSINENKYQAELSNTNLNSIQFLSKNQATAFIENDLLKSPVEFVKEDKSWRINPLGNSYDKYTRDQVMLAQLQSTKEEYVKSAILGQGLNYQNAWIKLVDITKN